MANAALRRPSYVLLALEQLAWVEYSAFPAAFGVLSLTKPGNGHPVLVLPGFTASDRSTQPLRTALRSKGYWVHGWDLGPNIGPHEYIIEGVARRLETIEQRHGAPVSLIGWSLGGVYARELARAFPHAVRQVITLGSPFRFRSGDRGFGSRLYDAIGPRRDPLAGRLPEEKRPPLPVPSTSIYTRTDGVVRWHACSTRPVRAARTSRSTAPTPGSPSTSRRWWPITDRLAQPAGEWEPFRPPLPLRHLFPRPASWRPRRARS